MSGYYGFGNLGDEAVLAGLLRALRRLEPDARVVVLSADPRRTAGLHGVDSEPRGLRGAWRALAGARVLVSGGGSLLQDVTSARSALYYLGIMALARFRGARVVWVAQGIGPVRRPWLRWLVGREARRAWAITVRDEASRQTLAAWGRLDPGRIEVVPDPAWVLAEVADHGRALLGSAPAASAGAAGPEERTPRPRPEALHVAVVWRDWPGQPAPAREAGRALGMALADLLPPRSRVTVMAFQPGQDLDPCRELAGALQAELERQARGANPEVAVAPAPEDPAQAVGAVWQFDLVVGVRLHALILAGAAGVPFVGVAYDPKVEGLLAQLRWPLEAIRPGEVADPAAWRARLSEALGRREALQERLAGVRDRMAREAVAVLRPVIALLGAGPRDARCPQPVEVLGMPVHPVSLDEAADIVARWLEAREPSRTRHVVTLNPEMVMRARADPAFASVVCGADLVVPDGVGVVWAARVLGHAMKGRVPGIELAERALATCARQRLPVFLLGGAPPGPHAPGVAEAAAERLRQRPDMAGLVVAGVHHGYFAWGSDEEERLLQRIEAARPALLLVGMGAPRQEQFIARHRDRLGPSVRVAIGVGGSLDVWAGRTRRAPALMRRLQLEWLFRVATEPRRLRRLAALPAFAAAVMTVRLGGIMGQRPRHRT